MYLKDTECCAIQEIAGLGDHNSAHDAMISFCHQSLPKPPRFCGLEAKRNTVYSFYLFTAACDDGSSPYGDDFADLILQEGLGEVIASGKVVNRAFHADHSNQVWIWTPNVEALRAWWELHKDDPISDENFDDDDDYEDDLDEERDE